MLTNTEPTGVWFFIVKGGPVMIPIIALSIIALAIILAKFWELWRFRAQLSKLYRHLHTLLEDGNLSGALHICREQNSSLGRLFEAALLYRGHERAELTRR